MSGADHSSATNSQDKSDTDEFAFTLVDANNATVMKILPADSSIRDWQAISWSRTFV
jgi:hypothetical protein